MKAPRAKAATVTVPTADVTGLLETLERRFKAFAARHSGLRWESVLGKLEASPKHVDAVLAMERSGGEPDVIGYDESADAFVFCDCSAESPKGRRSICYDAQALEARKENKPAASATGLAAAMGLELLTEEQYRHLQTLGAFDVKTSSWVQTPPGIRGLGGALFCDRRYGRVFTYHNGAESYYSGRAFRGRVLV